MTEAHALDVERLRVAVNESVQEVLTTRLNNPLREEASALTRGRDPGRSALFTAAVGEQYGVVAPVRVATVVELQRLHAVCHAEERRVLVGDGFRSLADWVLLDGPWSLSGRLAGVGELASASEYLNGSLLGSGAEYIDAWLAENAAELTVSLFSLSDAASVSVREIGREVRREEEWCICGVLEDAPPRVEAAFRVISGTRRR
jgi:hypothetical protein